MACCVNYIPVAHGNFLAVKALQIESDLVKSRPICEASSMSQSVAFKHDLKPAMKRPQTNLHTARRMINTHLGTKSALSKEIMEKERQILKEARGKWKKRFSASAN